MRTMFLPECDIEVPDHDGLKDYFSEMMTSHVVIQRFSFSLRIIYIINVYAHNVFACINVFACFLLEQGAIDFPGSVLII